MRTKQNLTLMKSFVLLIGLSMGTLCSAHAQPRCGAERTESYFRLLKQKRAALVVNHTSTIAGRHLLDSLWAAGIRPVKVFAPEHGFRGKADAGAHIADQTDRRTGLPILSLHGKSKKPSAEQLADIDLMVFDMQDVGARFYTYASTLYYVMQACAENGKELLVLDRPNPCDYIDGPMRQPEFRSFVSLLPVPVLHGCTLGELARMINGEGWLGKGLTCRLQVIPADGWKHGQAYSLPVKPSPNLPNDCAVALYPSLCLFEGTSVSVGRGTPYPFQIVGTPLLPAPQGSFRFKPEPTEGSDMNPPHKGQWCYGYRPDTAQVKGFSLQPVLRYYQAYKRQGKEKDFFTRPHWFDLLTGTDQVRLDIQAGKSEAEIRARWKSALIRYRSVRQKYLLYPDGRKPAARQ